MTIPKHADLIHAFADGKVLQFKNIEDTRWTDWTDCFCPRFFEDDEWRIKSDEPKKAVIATMRNVFGSVQQTVVGSKHHYTLVEDGFIRIPELDREITLPVEES